MDNKTNNTVIPIKFGLIHIFVWHHSFPYMFDTVSCMFLILFAFAPMIGMFTWMVPLFVLQRLIPPQFYGYILGIPLIFWCTLISTIIISITFTISNYIDKHVKSCTSSNLPQFICSELKKQCTLQRAPRLCLYAIWSILCCVFISFIFCVSPSLCLCAIFWASHELCKNDITGKFDVGDTIKYRKNLYHDCLDFFDRYDADYDFKIMGYHIFTILLSMQHIIENIENEKFEFNPNKLKSYFLCLQKDEMPCRHKWEVKYSNIRDFKVFVCLHIGTSLLIISHLALFWFWTWKYSYDQIPKLDDKHILKGYNDLIIFYICAQFSIVGAYISSIYISFEDIAIYHKFDFLRLNGEQHLNKTLNLMCESKCSFTGLYWKLLHIHLLQATMKKTLKLCIKDEWLWMLLCEFCTGHKDDNIFRDKQLMELLDQSGENLEKRNKFVSYFKHQLTVMNDKKRVTNLYDMSQVLR